MVLVHQAIVHVHTTPPPELVVHSMICNAFNPAAFDTHYSFACWIINLTVVQKLVGPS